MRSLSILLVLLLTTLALTSPTASNGQHGGDGDDHDDCLNQHDADKLRDTWISFFVKLDPVLAKATLVPDFHLFSESTNGVSGVSPVSQPQYASRDAFIAGQTAQTAESSSFTVVASDYGCNFFTFRWYLTSVPKEPVAGIDFVFLKKGTRMLEKAYSEWDTRHFLVDVGCTINCPTG